VAALGGETTDMLQRVWQEIGYPLDVRRVTRGTYIEALQRTGIKLGEFFYVLKYTKSFSDNN
jgi:hypothetical protein